ncbi:hypothetical protein [Nocardia spumae]|uniref:hypothetical protein n=1 Tax=Nocardia spumae TaxID=2887190 RepID=UPI001D13D7B9|nr:hypothetical protein [Nocardia spumae]
MAEFEDRIRDAAVREDLIQTIAAFCERHDIDFDREDIHRFPEAQASGTSGGGDPMWVYRTGPTTDRWVHM